MLNIIVVVKEIQIKITMRYYTSIGMTKIKKTDHTNVGEDVERLECSYAAVGM